MKEIIIKGAREHNLKNIDLAIPRGKLVVFTGVSGSGKSTLAFDTIFAEGQRRYLESLSSYARQFLGQMDKPDVDYIDGLSPAISIDQKSVSRNPRSTVGTVTEINDYLRLLYSKIGIPHCPECGREISAMATDEIVDRIIGLEGAGEMEILSPVVRQRKGEYLALFNEMWKRGFTYAYVDGRFCRLEECQKIRLERYEKHDVDVMVDKLPVSDTNLSRIFESVEKALRLSDGIVKVRYASQEGKKGRKKTKENVYNQKMGCPIHEIGFPELEPRLFSFNSPYGACPICEGLGLKKEIDPERVVPDRNKTIAQGAVMPWSYKPNNYQGTLLRAVANHYRIPDNKRFRDLPERQQEAILGGTEDEDLVKVRYRFRSGSGHFNLYWKGVVSYLEERYRKTSSDAVRADIEKYMSQKPCVACQGSRYRSEVGFVTVGKKNIIEVSRSSIREALDFFRNLKVSKREELIAGRILKEVINRLSFLDDVGLDYLTLGRSASSLSGGESQRIRLASQIGSQLVGVLYVLDEPSIGLHARDNVRLIETLEKLRDLGNSLIVIEHDEETMLRSDWLVDIGPGAGKMGGEIVATGEPEKIVRHKKSLTAKYLRKEMRIDVPKERRLAAKKKTVVVRQASQNNLKNITVEFPLKMLTCVTGVSGSGKSTLVEEILYRALANRLHRLTEVPGRHKEILGAENIDKVIMIDQSPIGRTPRSNPATYTGVFTPIRELMAATKDAKTRGYGPSRFSFNVHGGRCDNCKGEGFLKIEMQFMPDVYLPCDVCQGRRYNSETLQVRYKGKTIADILKMTVSEAAVFFQNYPYIKNTLQVLDDVGLGYIELGQNATTLSGGEAQRIKLASELARKATGNTMYILDEPTTGLHFDDIRKLLDVLGRLVDGGNTVIIIEHNMDVIKCADWIIDLGPEGGDGGGRVIATGTPEEVAGLGEESQTGRFLRQALEKS